MKDKKNNKKTRVGEGERKREGVTNNEGTKTILSDCTLGVCLEEE